MIRILPLTPGRGIAPEGFVLVEAGTFTMGSPPDERYRDDLEIQHQVTLTRKFYMSKYEGNPGSLGKGNGN